MQYIEDICFFKKTTKVLTAARGAYITKGFGDKSSERIPSVSLRRTESSVFTREYSELMFFLTLSKSVGSDLSIQPKISKI